MKLPVHFWCLVFVLAQGIGIPVSAQPAAEPPRPFASSRELLESIGVDDSHFRMFMDGEPAGLDEQEPLLRVLFAVRKSPPAEIERFAQSEFRLPAEGEARDAVRGEIFRLAGRVTRVSLEKPLPEVVDRYEMKQYYRCQVVLEPANTRAVVFALAVPRAWPLDQDFSERVSLLGFFLKLASDETEQGTMPVFAAQRVAWHAEGLLGDLGMDTGLFDAVQNKAPIRVDERECFYQLLEAAGRANPAELFALTQRPPENDYSVVPLFNDPARQHGQLVAVTGTARRAIVVKLDAQREADIIRRLGTDHYYQLEVFTQDSQGNPLVFCVRELPPGMPSGPAIYEAVRIPAFFFKSWAYRLQPQEGQAEAGHQLAPMLVGNQVRWIPAESGRSPLVGALAGGFFILVLAAAWIGVSAYNRGDRKFHARVLAKNFQPEEGKSLNDLKLETRDGPDFSNLP